MAVNLSPVGGVAAQFFTSTGAVLTGGKLYTYAAGTTTPATTYTTSQGNIAWTNPVVLDAAGRVPGSGEIWLLDGAIYKFVLKDSNDVLIATYDNITGINSNAVAYTNQQEIVTATAGQTVFDLTISYQPGTNSLSVFVDGVNQYGPGALYSYVETDGNTVTFNSGLHVGAEVKFTTTQQQGAGVTDASQITYDPPFTGSVTTNVEAKLAQIVSVMDFGADPTGATDSSAAIQAAIDSGYVDVFFPAGTYLVSNQLVLPSVSFYDNNPGRKFYGASAVIVAGVANGFIIAGTNYSSKWTFENLTYTSDPGAAYAGVFDVTYLYNCWFWHNVFANITGGVFYTAAYSQSLVIESNHFGQCHYVVDFDRAYNLTFNENFLEGCDYGVIVDGTNDPALSMARIQNNVIEGIPSSTGGMPISLGATYGCIISGNYMEANQGPAITSNNCYIKLDNGTYTHRGLTIYGNQFQPTAGQIADTSFYIIKLANPVNGVNDRPAIFGNVTSSPNLLNVDEYASALFANFAAGAVVNSAAPVLQNRIGYTIASNLSFVNNRSTAYSAGTWKLFTLYDVAAPATLTVDGALRMYNSGGTLMGLTHFSFKLGVTVDATSTTRATILSAIQLVESSGNIAVATPYYTNYWNNAGTSAISVSVSGNDVTISLDKFNDYSYSPYGTVVSVGPIVSVQAASQEYQNISISYP